jgi:pimeloyl-ACP methyl ester carboxylesterase
VVLIMGLGMQLVAWPQALVDGLVDAGYQVLRVDNRDIGRSGSGPLRRHTPTSLALLRHLLQQRFVPPYELADMSFDVLALCDALGLRQPHLIGVSLGGMIAQKAAFLSPQRVGSVVSIMSTAGSRMAPWPKLSILPHFLTRPPRSASLARQVEHFVGLFQLIGDIQEGDPELARLREHMELALRRAYRPEGTARQLLAVLAEPDRSREVAQIRCPVTLIHGERDPLVPIGALDQLARLLPQASVHRIPKLAHHLPEWSVPVLLQLILAHLKAGSSGQ